MCGIGGYVDPSGALERASVLRSIAAALVHRGPDGEGFFTHGPFGLAHRRLAIIDLSEGGSQPMRVGPIAVVFNGEIYNYRELREELRIAGQSFSGSSDTEVLARAYLQWGEQFVKRLRGMWAFAIADMRTQTLLCSRDPFGIKPFYYARHGGGLVFASEPQALIRAGVPARVNLALAAQYLALGVTDHTCETFFDGIVQLGAGESIAISADATIRSLGAQHYLESGAPATFGQFAGALQGVSALASAQRCSRRHLLVRRSGFLDRGSSRLRCDTRRGRPAFRGSHRGLRRPQHRRAKVRRRCGCTLRS